MSQLSLDLSNFKKPPFDAMPLHKCIAQMTESKHQLLQNPFDDDNVLSWLATHQKHEVQLLEQLSEHAKDVLHDEQDIAVLKECANTLTFFRTALAKVNKVEQACLKNHRDYMKLKSLWDDYDNQLAELKSEKQSILTWRQSKKKMNALARIEQAEIDLLESFECRGYRRNCHFENKITGVFNTSVTPSRATCYQTFHGLRSTLDETLLTLIQKKEKQNRLKQSQFSIEKLTDFLDLAEIEQSSTNKAIITLDELNALSLNFDSIDTALPDHFHLKITQGVGRNKGIIYKTFTSTDHAWFKDKLGTVYDQAEIKVNSSSCDVIDINLFIVSQSFKNKEALDSLNNSTVKERQFIARVSQAFFIDKGRKLGKSAAFGLLSIIRGDEKNAHSAIFSYGYILRELLVGEFKIPKANTDSLPKLFKSAQHAFAA